MEPGAQPWIWKISFNLHVNEISFSYERMDTKARFEKEAKSNSEMAYWGHNSRLVKKVRIKEI